TLKHTNESIRHVEYVAGIYAMVEIHNLCIQFQDASIAHVLGICECPPVEFPRSNQSVVAVVAQGAPGSVIRIGSGKHFCTAVLFGQIGFMRFEVCCSSPLPLTDKEIAESLTRVLNVPPQHVRMRHETGFGSSVRVSGAI